MSYKFKITTENRKNGLKKAFLKVFHFQGPKYTTRYTKYIVYIDPENTTDINYNDKVIGSFQHWNDNTTIVVIRKLQPRIFVES